MTKTLTSHGLDTSTKCVTEPCYKKLLENIEHRMDDLKKLNSELLRKNRLFTELSKYTESDLEHYLNEIKINSIILNFLNFISYQ